MSKHRRHRPAPARMPDAPMLAAPKTDATAPVPAAGSTGALPANPAPGLAGASGMGGYIDHPYDPPEITAQEIQAQGRRERGAAGTTNFYGYITGEEYNPKLAGLTAMPVYAEMRNDAQVQASLLICKQPLLSADWKVNPPEGGDDTDAKIASFCHDALFGQGAMKDPWSFVLSHLLLRLDFGFSCLETVYRIADDRTTRIERLAPRLPRTVHRFEVDSNGQLTAVVQLAYKDLSYNYWTIPAQYCVLTVHQREGDNYYGRSLLRSCYENWYRKKQAYSIDSVRLDRYGVGIPMAEVNEEGVAASVEELAAIDKTLKGLRSFEKGYLRTTPRVKFSILTPGGSGQGGADAMKSIEHHNEQIMANILATFLSKGGGTEGIVGSNRTASLASVFFSALESTAFEIAQDLNSQLIKPLCDLNFNMQGRRYPTIMVSNVADMDMVELAVNLDKLGTKNFITPDDGIEDVLRKGLKLPPLDATMRGKDRKPAPPPAPIIMPGSGIPPTPGATPEPGPAADGTKKPAGTAGARVDEGPSADGGQDGKKAAGKNPFAKTTDKKPADDKTPAGDKAKTSHGHAPIRLRQSYTDPESGLVFGREPTERESSIFALREVPRFLDMATAKLEASIAQIRQQQLESLAETIAKKDARPTADFTDIRPDNFTVPMKGAIERAIKAAQVETAEYGATQVRNELRRQGATIAASAPTWTEDSYALSARAVRLAKKRTTGIVPPGEDATAAAGKQKAKSQLVSSAKVTGEKLDDAWFARILETGVRIRRGGSQGDLLTQGIVDALTSETGKGILRDAKGEVNEAFAVGRAVEASVQQENIEICVFSSVLDSSTCSACEAVDGTETEYDSEVYQDLMPPYSECEGNLGTPDACRCVWLFMMADRQEGRQ